MKRKSGWITPQDHTLCAESHRNIHTLAKCFQSPAEFALAIYVVFPVSSDVMWGKKSKPHAWMRSCTSPVWPQVAAACRGVHSSLSQAFTHAPASSRHCTTSTKSSMQHWQGRNETYYTHGYGKQPIHLYRPALCCGSTKFPGGRVSQRLYKDLSVLTNMPPLNFYL